MQLLVDSVPTLKTGADFSAVSSLIMGHSWRTHYADADRVEPTWPSNKARKKYKPHFENHIQSNQLTNAYE